MTLKSICEERLLGKIADLNATEFEMEQVEDDLYKCEEDASYAQKSFAIKASDLRHELTVAKEKLSKEEDQKERLSRKLSQTRKRLQNVRNVKL